MEREKEIQRDNKHVSGGNVSESSFSQFQLCIPCSKGPDELCHGGDLKSLAKSREPSTTTGGSAISRKNHPGPTLENITISEENQETASKLDFWSLKLSQSSLQEGGATLRGSARKPREAQKWVLTLFFPSLKKCSKHLVSSNRNNPFKRPFEPPQGSRRIVGGPNV